MAKKKSTIEGGTQPEQSQATEAGRAKCSQCKIEHRDSKLVDGLCPSCTPPGVN